MLKELELIGLFLDLLLSNRKWKKIKKTNNINCHVTANAVCRILNSLGYNAKVVCGIVDHKVKHSWIETNNSFIETDTRQIFPNEFSSPFVRMFSKDDEKYKRYEKLLVNYKTNEKIIEMLYQDLLKAV